MKKIDKKTQRLKKTLKREYEAIVKGSSYYCAPWLASTLFSKALDRVTTIRSVRRVCNRFNTTLHLIRK